MQFAVRQRVCRVSFCVLCLLPTLAVGGAVLLARTPIYHAARRDAWQAQLVAGLGLDVRLGDFDTLGGGTFAARDIELRDPESKRWLVRARSAEVSQTDAGVVVALGQPELSFERLSRLVELLHEHVLLRPADSDTQIQLAAHSLTLHLQQHAETLLDVQFGVKSDRSGTEALIQFRGVASEPGELVRLRVVRNRQLDPPATGWELHTDPSPIPCTLAVAWLPGLESLGLESTFQGSVWAERGKLGWEAEVAGVFQHIDLDRLVTGRFQHKLSGTADLMLSRLLVERGRVTEATGQLSCEGGVVSQSLLQAAETCLGLTRHARTPDAMLLRYSQLSIDFALDGSGLAIAGSGGPPLSFLADAQGALLSSETALRVSPIRLIQLLVPQSDLLVPATKETAALIGTFPLPQVSTSETRSADASYSPLRLRN